MTKHSGTSLGVALAALALAGCQLACTKQLVGNQSAVVVLLDYSKTFAPYDELDASALKQVAESITKAMEQGWLRQPMKVQWAAFGDQGLLPILPCGPPVVFAQKLTKTAAISPDVRASTNIDDFKAWLDGCVKAVRAQSSATQEDTDLSGALAFAANATRDAAKTRLIVAYTDLLEDLPDGRESTPYNLSGSHVLVVWRPGADDRKQPAEVQKRVTKSAKAFTAMGAIRVCDTPSQSITSGDVLSCLTK